MEFVSIVEMGVRARLLCAGKYKGVYKHVRTL